MSDTENRRSLTGLRIAAAFVLAVPIGAAGIYAASDSCEAWQTLRGPPDPGVWVHGLCTQPAVWLVVRSVMIVSWWTWVAAFLATKVAASRYVAVGIGVGVGSAALAGVLLVADFPFPAVRVLLATHFWKYAALAIAITTLVGQYRSSRAKAAAGDPGLWPLAGIVTVFALMALPTFEIVRYRCENLPRMVRASLLSEIDSTSTPSHAMAALRRLNVEPVLRAPPECAEAASRDNLHFICPDGYGIEVRVPVHYGLCSVVPEDDEVFFRARFNPHGAISEWTI